MEGQRLVVRDQRSEVSQAYWRLVEWVAGSVDRADIEAVHREFQARGLAPRGVRLRASMYRDGRFYASSSSSRSSG